MKNPYLEAPTQVLALHYDGIGAPRVTAKGDGELAAMMLTLANAHDVPIYRDVHLSRLLAQVELDSEIPMPLYIAVAEVMSLAYRLKDKPAPIVQKRRGGQTFEHEHT